jgi:hypothetical protein
MATSDALQFYWLGLQSDKSSYPRFKWLDPMTPALSLPGSYKHWGLFMPANVYEPYAFAPPEYCAGGNFTETYQAVSGWADTSCDDIRIYICQIRREGGWAAATAQAACQSSQPACLAARCSPHSCVCVQRVPPSPLHPLPQPTLPALLLTGAGAQPPATRL